MTIDKDLNFTPGRPVNKKKMVYPDHYAIILEMKNLPLSNGKSSVSERFQTWNLNKDGGWEKFQECTEDNEVFKKETEKDNENPTEVMKVIENELNKVKYKSFGKVTVRNNPKSNKEIKKLQEEKLDILNKVEKSETRDEKIQSIEENITEEVLSNQRKQLEKELSALKKMKNEKRKSAVIFNLRDKVIGQKKVTQEATTMKDPVTKKPLTKRK